MVGDKYGETMRSRKRELGHAMTRLTIKEIGMCAVGDKFDGESMEQFEEDMAKKLSKKNKKR